MFGVSIEWLLGGVWCSIRQVIVFHSMCYTFRLKGMEPSTGTRKHIVYCLDHTLLVGICSPMARRTKLRQFRV